MQQRALSNTKIEVIWNSSVVEAYGDENGKYVLGGLKNLVPINQASARTGRRNFASTNNYHEFKGTFCRVSGPTSWASNHQVENDFSVMNKGVAEKNPLSKSTSFSEDGVKPETSKASSEQVDAPVSVSTEPFTRCNSCSGLTACCD
ncbi:unnamed protein product [Eruca vesicaria subsp. sativa]|uniref:Uncharacterized protein n=1 Tax=Eruca vesicaria subsp. sativa TaxID=29727 RepID=A0ABC8IU53_ERUVS|nr:unnamed protein product [Eruca vesicaria subsp. sativa]